MSYTLIGPICDCEPSNATQYQGFHYAGAYAFAADQENHLIRKIQCSDTSVVSTSGDIGETFIWTVDPDTMHLYVIVFTGGARRCVAYDTADWSTVSSTSGWPPFNEETIFGFGVLVLVTGGADKFLVYAADGLYQLINLDGTERATIAMDFAADGASFNGICPDNAGGFWGLETDRSAVGPDYAHLRHVNNAGVSTVFDISSGIDVNVPDHGDDVYNMVLGASLLLVNAAGHPIIKQIPNSPWWPLPVVTNPETFLRFSTAGTLLGTLATTNGPSWANGSFFDSSVMGITAADEFGWWNQGALQRLSGTSFATVETVDLSAYPALSALRGFEPNTYVWDGTTYWLINNGWPEDNLFRLVPGEAPPPPDSDEEPQIFVTT